MRILLRNGNRRHGARCLGRPLDSGCAAFFVKELRGNEIVEGLFKVGLWVMEERVPSVPARGAAGAGRVDNTVEDLGIVLVLTMFQGNVIELIYLRVVLCLLLANTGTEAVNAAEVAFYIGAPLT